MKAVLRSVFALLVLIAALPAGSGTVAQQSGDSVTSVITGSVVEFDSSDGAAFEPDYYVLEAMAPGVQQESFYIITDMGQVVISFATGTQTPDSYIQETITDAPGWYSDYVDILGYGSTDESGWYLFRGTFRNNYHDYSYGEVYRGDEKGSVLSVYMYAIDPDSTVSLYRWVENHLLIDGEHVYSTSEAPAIQAMLNGTSEIEPQRIYAFTSEIEDWEDLGLVSDSKWISPIRGVEVEWNTENLYFPTLRADSIETEPEISGEYLYLYSQNPDGMISIAIHETQTHPAGVSFLDHYSEYYTTPEWLSGQNYNEPLHGSVQSETALSVIYSYSGSTGENRVYIRTVWELTPGEMYVFDVSNHPDLIAETYFHAIESVTLDGAPVETLWTYDELTALFPPSTEVAEESDVTPRDITSDRPLIDGHHIWAPQD